MIKVIVFTDLNLAFFTRKKYGSGPATAEFPGTRSVKDLIESLGIPHVEIGSVEISGSCSNEKLSLTDLITQDCRLNVLSVEAARSTGHYAAEFPSPGDAGFIFIPDVHLGRLAVNLRMLGFPADYSNSRSDEELARLADSAVNGLKAIVLSCDRGLMMRRCIKYGMVVRSREPVRQTIEVLQRFGLSGRAAPFSLCFNCGGLLEDAGALDNLSDAEKNSLPLKVRRLQDEYRRCTSCGQLFWKGSHYRSLAAKAAGIISAAAG